MDFGTAMAIFAVIFGLGLQVSLTLVVASWLYLKWKNRK